MSNHGLAPEFAQATKGGPEMTATATPLTLDAHASRAWVRRFARTTPGLVVAIAVGVAASCILAGIVSAAALNGRISEQKAVLEHSEPFAYAAQNLYAASSAADAAAATAFLSGGYADPADARAISAGTRRRGFRRWPTPPQARPTPETRKALAQVSANLATYAGLVEAARANNVQGFPIGSAYLREALGLDADEPASRRREDLLRRPRPGRPGTAARRLPAQAGAGTSRARLGRHCHRIGDHVPAHQPNVQSRAARSGGHRAVGHRLHRRRRPSGRGRHRARPHRGHRAVRTARGGPHPCPAGPHRRNPAADHPRRHHRQREVLLRAHRRSRRPHRHRFAGRQRGRRRMGGQPPHAGGRLSRRRLPGRGRAGARHRPGRVGRAVRRRRIEPSRRDRAVPCHHAQPRGGRRALPRVDPDGHPRADGTGRVRLPSSGCGHGCGSSYEHTHRDDRRGSGPRPCWLWCVRRRRRRRCRSHLRR